MKKQYFTGIDYSMSCPAICICDGTNFDFENLHFLYVNSKKSWVGEFMDGQIEGVKSLPTSESSMKRIEHLSTQMLNFVNRCDDGSDLYIAVEDYAFAANGNITLLAENMGVLKYRLMHEFDIEVLPIAVQSAKKYARSFLDVERDSNGKLIKMDKTQMHNAFINATGVNLLKVFGLSTLCTKSGSPTRSNPITDIVDSYFLARFMFEKKLSI